MTDRELVEKKLAAIETYVADLRRLARPAEIGRDIREERFVEHTLQLAIQAALDVASHIVADERLAPFFETTRRRPDPEPYPPASFKSCVFFSPSAIVTLRAAPTIASRKDGSYSSFKFRSVRAAM